MKSLFSDRYWPFCFLSVLVVLGLTRLAAAPGVSQLWGEAGAAWTPTSRLPDFSHAGYHEGEQPIPVVPQVTNVKDFGAVGDGVADDTHAIQAAIAATARGAVYLPPGRYKISDFLRVEKSGLVLRGAATATIRARVVDR